MRRRLVFIYASIVGAVAGVVIASTVAPVGLRGGLDTGAPLYLGAPIAAACIPLAASSAGVLVGWWALHNTMGGPT